MHRILRHWYRSWVMYEFYLKTYLFYYFIQYTRNIGDGKENLYKDDGHFVFNRINTSSHRSFRETFQSYHQCKPRRNHLETRITPLSVCIFLVSYSSHVHLSTLVTVYLLLPIKFSTYDCPLVHRRSIVDPIWLKLSYLLSPTLKIPSSTVLTSECTSCGLHQYTPQKSTFVSSYPVYTIREIRYDSVNTYTNSGDKVRFRKL